MKNLILFFIISTLTIATLNAQDWSTNVAPIVYNKCANCHHNDGSGHVNFTNVDTVKAYSASIYNYVSTGKMPPWPPNPAYTTFAHERRLSSNEVSTITTWINNNMPLGDTNLAPPIPIFNGAAILPQTPSGTFTMPTYTVTQIPGNTGDVYVNFAIPLNNASEIGLKGFEFLPGNPSIVHHALVYIDTGNTCLNLDASFAGPGYPGFGGAGSNTANLLGAYVPGTTPFLFPKNFGVNIPKNATLIFGMHYPKSAIGQLDSSRINYFIGNVTRPVIYAPILNHYSNILNGPLLIPANTIKTFTERFNMPADVSVFGIAPHMHLIGKNIKVFGIKPTQDTLPLIDIPSWDFEWQGMYYFKKILKIENGTKLYSTATFDNTAANINNPSSPPQLVKAGENTTDEMMLTYFALTTYFDGDEDISLENFASGVIAPPTYKETEFFPCYPNPASSNVYLKWYTEQSQDVHVELMDAFGKVLKHKKYNNAQGYRVEAIDIQDIPSGLYYIKLQSATDTKVLNVLKQ